MRLSGPLLHSLPPPRLAFHPLRFSDHALVRPECPAPAAAVAARLAEALRETRAAEAVAEGEVVRFNVGWATYPLGEVRVSAAGSAVRADYTVVTGDTFYSALWAVIVVGLVVIASLANGNGLGWVVGAASAAVVVQGWIIVWLRLAYHDRITRAFVASVRAVCAGAV